MKLNSALLHGSLMMVTMLSSFSAQSEIQNTDKGTEERPNTNNNQIKTLKVVTIEFSKDSNELTAKSKEMIETLIDKARSEGKVQEIKIAVWSDQPFPANSRDDLPKGDRKLAENRGHNIKNFLKHDLEVRWVHVYNMAEGANWLAEVFQTESSVLRKVFSTNNYKGKIKPEIILFRNHGGPSKAVLVVEHLRKSIVH
ncbi:MAG: hypothetical protein R3B45_15515 [Bdellovibrionota bacterium]